MRKIITRESHYPICNIKPCISLYTQVEFSGPSLNVVIDSINLISILEVPLNVHVTSNYNCLHCHTCMHIPTAIIMWWYWTAMLSVQVLREGLELAPRMLLSLARPWNQPLPPVTALPYRTPTSAVREGCKLPEICCYSWWRELQALECTRSHCLYQRLPCGFLSELFPYSVIFFFTLSKSFSILRNSYTF